MIPRKRQMHLPHSTPPEQGHLSFRVTHSPNRACQTTPFLILTVLRDESGTGGCGEAR